MSETLPVTREQIRAACAGIGLGINKVGKVRVLAQVGGEIVMVASDEVSAFDWNQTPAILDKGKILTALSLRGLRFAEKLGLRTHLLSADWTEISDRYPVLQPLSQLLAGRSMLVSKVEPLLVECVVRGWLVGSGLKEYRASGRVCDIELPPGLQEASFLEPPIFTPATKAREGLHDENISFAEAVDILGSPVANTVRERSMLLYSASALWAMWRGVALLDTKFEFGLTPSGEILLSDEVLTPDSSRFSPANQLKVGQTPISWDKQGLRDWLESQHWDKKSLPPPLPPDVVEKTRAAYLKAYRHLVGQEFVG